MLASSLVKVLAIEVLGLLSPTIAYTVNDISCPHGHVGFLHDSYTYYNGPLQKFTSVIKSFFDIAWYNAGVPANATTGVDNVPGATRSGSFQGAIYNDTPTAYRFHSDVLEYTYHAAVPVTLQLGNMPPLHLYGYAETMRFESICSGQATYVDLITYICANNQALAYTVWHGLHSTTFDPLASSIGEIDMAGDCPWEFQSNKTWNQPCCMGQTLQAQRYIWGTFLPDHLFAKLPTVSADLRGRTYLVTGANVGLGLATAIHLARLNPARIILSVRSRAKGETAKHEILAQTKFSGVLEAWELEMEDFSSVTAFAKRANSELDRLDGAVLNAGLFAKGWHTTQDGWERVLQVNVISNGLLGVLLLPLLQATSKLPPPHSDVLQTPPHLTITGSGAQYRAQLPSTTDILQTLNDPNKAAEKDRYAISKLYILLLAREMSKLPHAEGVVVNVTHPGLVYTDLARDFTAGMSGRIVNFLFRNIGWTAAKGAINLLYALLSPTPPGAYIAVCQIRPPPEWVNTEEGVKVQKTAWNELVAVWRRISAEVDNIVGP